MCAGARDARRIGLACKIERRPLSLGQNEWLPEPQLRGNILDLPSINSASMSAAEIASCKCILARTASFRLGGGRRIADFSRYQYACLKNLGTS